MPESLRCWWRTVLPATMPLVLVLLAGTWGEARAQSDDLRVMTFNIRYGTANDGANAWANRRALVFEVIESTSPAVLGVQEALRFQLDEMLEAMPGYGLVGAGRDDGVEAGEYSAILYDTARLRVAAQGTFWFSESPGEPGTVAWGARIPRICTWARFTDRAGRSFWVFNNHWDHESQESRERSARLLLDRIAARPAPDPVIVTGDFNAGPDNPAFLSLVADPRVELTDSYQALHAMGPDIGTFNGFEGRRDGPKIDAILVSAGWTVVDAQIDRTSAGGRYPSDHFPVTAVLRWEER